MVNVLCVMDFRFILMQMASEATISTLDTGWLALKRLVTDGVRSPASKLVYSRALDHFHNWYFREPRSALSKAVVQDYRSDLERSGYSTATVRLYLTVVKRLVIEAADNGLFAPAAAAAIQRIRCSRNRGLRIGLWLSQDEASRLLSVPEQTRLKGARDRAILAIAVGCGLRRTEIASLTIGHIQLRDSRWIIADLPGKGQRLRTVVIPSWVKLCLDDWLSKSGIATGRVFRSMRKGDALSGETLTPQAIYEIARTYGFRIGKDLAPHDLRRTFAKLAHSGQTPLEQIQFSLGHASLTTTERYLGLKQDLTRAPGDTFNPFGQSGSLTAIEEDNAADHSEFAKQTC